MTSTATETLHAIAQRSAAKSTELTSDGVAEISCENLNAMLAFYEGLGFHVERQTEAFAVLFGFSTRIFLLQDPKAATRKRGVNIRLLVPNVDMVWDCIRTIGVPIGEGPADRGYGIRDFLIEDPCGLDIRFAQVL